MSEQSVVVGEDSRKIPVVEIFGPTVQGEGFMIGQMTHFLRLGGCGYRCSWCDSMHAVLPDEVKKNAIRMSIDEIGTSLVKLGDSRDGAKWVTISGGDPVMHDLLMLSRHLRLEKFYKIAVETQGQLWRDWLMHCQHVTVSPKPPSSGESEKTDYATLDRYVKVLHNREPEADQMSFKVVVFDEGDLVWALDIHKRWPYVPFYLSVGTMPDDSTSSIIGNYRWLIETVKNGQYSDVGNIRILPQMHVLLWGHRLGV